MSSRSGSHRVERHRSISDPTVSPPDKLGRVSTDKQVVGDARDPDFLRSIRPWIEAYASYFRSEVSGLEHVPDSGPMLIVGNHNGGQLPPDLPILLSAWWRERGLDDPIYTLMHSIMFSSPVLGKLVERGGAIEASREQAEAVLADGGILVDFPGGDHEVFRPWSDRNKIDFDGRRGFIRLALRTGVPVVPMVSVGAHETLFVLTRGDWLAKRSRLARMLRVSVIPITLGPPFGVQLPGIPAFPLPAKVTVELLEPRDWNERYGPEDAEDDAIVDACYDELTTAMQSAMDRMAAKRRYPIIG